MAEKPVELDTVTVTALADSHGPENWRQEIDEDALASAANTGTAVNAIVLSADIRASTILMREATDPVYFASIISGFVTAAKHVLRARKGWFDKFTGDGFLAYWIYGERNPEDYVPEVAHFVNETLSYFRSVVAEDLRSYTRNFPARAGLSIGIDGGKVNLVQVAGDLTVMGAPVVGAVRMVGVAQPYETVVNGFLGSALIKNHGMKLELQFDVRREIRGTKEYPDGQEVYLVRFLQPLDIEEATEERAASGPDGVNRER